MSSLRLFASVRAFRFWTGSSSPPVLGIKSIEFKIDVTTGSRLPKAHACFYSIELPLYSKSEDLESAVLTAIRGSCGMYD
jgi:hypothetical protein